jgi:hypothetical protein
MTEVIIELEGGLVQRFILTTRKVEVAVLDDDLLEDLYPKLDLGSFFLSEPDPKRGPASCKGAEEEIRFSGCLSSA